MDHITHDLLTRIIDQRSRFELLSALFGDMLLERGVDIEYWTEASKNEIGHELIRLRRIKHQTIDKKEQSY